MSGQSTVELVNIKGDSLYASDGLLADSDCSTYNLMAENAREHGGSLGTMSTRRPVEEPQNYPSVSQGMYVGAAYPAHGDFNINVSFLPNLPVKHPANFQLSRDFGIFYSDPTGESLSFRLHIFLLHFNAGHLEVRRMACGVGKEDLKRISGQVNWRIALAGADSC